MIDLQASNGYVAEIEHDTTILPTPVGVSPDSDPAHTSMCHCMVSFSKLNPPIKLGTASKACKSVCEVILSYSQILVQH